MGHVLLAPDKFKGSLTAEEVAEALAEGIGAVRPDLAVRTVPVADGGDGTVAAALAAGFTRLAVPTTGPTGLPLTAAIAVRDGVAVIETAAACGLSQLPGGELAPLEATSAGIAPLILAAVDAGCRTVVLGVGGSACTDGGIGLIAELGARIDGDDVDLSTVDDRVHGVEIVLACDVDNPLLGEFGAARVFGPQKGADPEQVQILERRLTRWADAVVAAGGVDARDTPGAGAAGGIGFAALSVLRARRESGIEFLLALVGFPGQLAGADLVITGEGSLDAQSLHGKAPIGVVDAARAAGITAVAVAGRCQLARAELAEAGIAAAYVLLDIEPDPARCMREAADLLVTVGERIAREWLS